MNQRTSMWLARGLCALCIALTVGGLALEARNRTAGMGAFIFPNAIVMAVCFPIVGMLIATHQPRNSVGWLFCVIGLCEALPLFTVPYAIYTLGVNTGEYPGGEVISWLAYWTFFPGVALIPFVLALFPDGHLLSARWRWLTWVTVIGVVVGTVSLAWTSWSFRGEGLVPYLREGATLENTQNTALNVTGVVLLLISAIGSTLAIGLRFYRSRGVERLQMKWCVYAIALVVGLQPFVLVLSSTEDVAGSTLFSRVLLALYTLAMAGLAIAIGVAILKYRLYDIDLIINRTLVYGAITVILSAIWATSTTLIQKIAAELAGSSAAATGTIVSTVVVISLFQPLRHAIENWVNERFYPENLDLMRDFVELTVSSLDLEEISALIVERIPRLMRSNRAAMFLHGGDNTFEAVTHWQVSPDDLRLIALPSAMHDRWGRVRAVQQPDDQAFRLLVPLFIPRLRREEVVGVLALGPRQGGQGYSWDDRRGLTEFGGEVGKKLLAAQLATRKTKPEPRVRDATAIMTGDGRSQSTDGSLPKIVAPDGSSPNADGVLADAQSAG